MNEVLENLVLLQELEGSTPSKSTGTSKADEVRRRIPANILQHYDRLRARGKKGISYVRHGVCSQCHMQVAVGLLASLRRVDDIHRCENCGSYLRIAEEASPVLQMPTRNLKPVRRGRPRKQVAHVV